MTEAIEITTFKLVRGKTASDFGFSTRFSG